MKIHQEGIPDKVDKAAYWHVYQLLETYCIKYKAACDVIVKQHQQKKKQTVAELSKSQYQSLYNFIESKVFPKVKVWDRANSEICTHVLKDSLRFLDIDDGEAKMYRDNVIYSIGRIFTCLKNAMNRKIRLEYIGKSLL